MNLALILTIAVIGGPFLIGYLWDKIAPDSLENMPSGLATILIILWFFTSIIGSMGIHQTYSDTISYYDKEHKYYIYSLGNDKYLEGSFGLFTGTIGETDYYFFFVNYRGGMQREKLKVSQCYIVEDTNDRPYVSQTTERYRDEDKFWKVWDEPSPYKYTFHVPKNTIVRDFKVR